MDETLEQVTSHRDQLKAELDSLNPKYDEAMLALKDARALNETLTAERDKARQEATASTKQIEDQIQARAAECEAAQKAFRELQRTTAERKSASDTAIAELRQQLQEADEERLALRSALDKKNAALAPLVKGVSEQLAAIQAALDAGG